ncbi:hypothetical protein [Diaminobutyricimonas sp. LJ205]|uniref:hypothetical protein n=1 Tax=Diaminobutyricimonas sp. LJ205 TaxID=2683590 RepID=UPI0012F51822|nr:hypothetical protein [Diaminobutyricimonas sp. LJ205]
MTFWDVLARALRRWPILLAGLLLTAGAAVWVLDARPVYFAEVRVVFLPPADISPNPYARTSQSLVELAGAVGRALEGGSSDARSVSQGVTMVGEGERDGHAIRQPNIGGQWAYAFDTPALDVQAVGATGEAVEREIAGAVTRIKGELTEMQARLDVPAHSRVRLQLSPSEPQVMEYGGSRVRALAGTLAAGGLVTFLALGMPGRRGRSADPKSDLTARGSTRPDSTR